MKRKVVFEDAERDQYHEKMCSILVQFHNKVPASFSVYGDSCLDQHHVCNFG